MLLRHGVCLQMMNSLLILGIISHQCVRVLAEAKFSFCTLALVMQVVFEKLCPL